jgi:hypothetical protein
MQILTRSILNRQAEGVASCSKSWAVSLFSSMCVCLRSVSPRPQRGTPHTAAEATRVISISEVHAGMLLMDEFALKAKLTTQNLVQPKPSNNRDSMLRVLLLLLTRSL